MSRPAPPPGGCLEYVQATYPMVVSFPAEQVACRWCPFCHGENNFQRYRCYLTAEILMWQDKTIGQRCPLTFIETEENEDD